LQRLPTSGGHDGCAPLAADLTGARLYEANLVGAIADNLPELLWRSQLQTDIQPNPHTSSTDLSPVRSDLSSNGENTDATTICTTPVRKTPGSALFVCFYVNISGDPSRGQPCLWGWRVVRRQRAP
jgi:hypothetical protein